MIDTTKPSTLTPGTSEKAGHIEQDQHGVLRWVYELNLWKNPTVLITVAKVLLLSLFIVCLIIFFILLADDGFMPALRFLLPFLGITGGIMAGLLILGYLLYILIVGGKYCVLFEMDSKKIVHRQIQSQYQKAQVLGLLTAFLGAAAGNPTVTGAGLLSATRQSLTTRFSSVRRIKIVKRRHVIYLAEAFTRNQVYAESDDFDQICEFILSHCPKATVKRR